MDIKEVGEYELVDDIEPVEATAAADDILAKVSPTPAGEALEFVDVPQTSDVQKQFEQIEPVTKVVLVEDSQGVTRQHNIYELAGKYWVSGIQGPEPACADTPEGAQKLLQAYYQPPEQTTAIPAEWAEFMKNNQPPKV
jgi:hypothetical protein